MDGGLLARPRLHGKTDHHPDENWLTEWPSSAYKICLGVMSRREPARGLLRAREPDRMNTSENPENAHGRPSATATPRRRATLAGLAMAAGILLVAAPSCRAKARLAPPQGAPTASVRARSAPIPPVPAEGAPMTPAPARSAQTLAAPAQSAQTASAAARSAQTPPAPAPGTPGPPVPAQGAPAVPDRSVPTPPAGEDWNEAQIPWLSYEKGLIAAKEQKKPVCLIFYTEWCPHCSAYRRVFQNEKVVEQSRKFVMIRLNKVKNAEISHKYAPDGEYIPRTYFLSSSGELDPGIHAPRDQFKYFYDEAAPESILAGMDEALKKLK